MELYSFDCNIICGEGAWAIGGTVARMQQVDLSSPKEAAFQHEEFVIHKPVFEQKLPSEVLGLAGRVHWDGGAKQKEGVGYGGFVGWTAAGECVEGFGHYYGKAVSTNNEAEATAMVEAV